LIEEDYNEKERTALARGLLDLVLSGSESLKIKPLDR
jgi:hypothetical protein